MLDSSVSAAADALPTIEFVPWGEMDALYEATVQCVEESVVNALVAGRSMIGRDGHRSPGLPLGCLGELFGR